MPTVQIDRPLVKTLDLDAVPRDVTAWDEEAFQTLISLDLTEEQRTRVLEPGLTFPRQTAVIAVHWHSEFVPMELIDERLNRMFPHRGHELIIPTDHNVLNSRNGFTGVEIDCHSREFHRKVQLLVHFEEGKVREAHTLRAMLAHTFRYRSGQLYEYLATILDPAHEERLHEAAAAVGAHEDLVEFVRIHVAKLRMMLEAKEHVTPADAVKNKLVANYFDCLRDRYDRTLINHAQLFLKTVKELVKANFRLDYFYQTEEIIAECRALGGCIVIPHPEQFWPVLLADYDVDGYEVWNPQSREYTEFLINVVIKQNKTIRRGERPLMIFMGDDTHMGEKVKEPRHQAPDKAGREIGVQRAWDDLSIRKSLVLAGIDRQSIIAEYKARLTG